MLGLLGVFGKSFPADLAAAIAADVDQFATMSMRVTPQVLNSMDDANLWDDPVRRYMLPAATDRDPIWPSHPEAKRDSLHETDMSVVEGLVWRYPTKALVELATTCPVYCGHCTRMDLVGPDVSGVEKHRMLVRRDERLDAILSFLKSTPSIRDLVVSGGDLTNVAPDLLEVFVSRVIDIGHIRNIRLATKGLVVLPQHFFQDAVLRSLERIARKARGAGIEIAVHTHTNHARSVTPLVAEAATRLYDIGISAIRNQGVILNGVNASAGDLLDLSFVLLDAARITPYYFYMCDMIPNSEHWRIPLHQAQTIQAQIMGYLPGFATPRVVCDVPFVGKRWVHQAHDYDRIRGISRWTKNYWTSLDARDTDPMENTYVYFDPIWSLPAAGQNYWLQGRHPGPRV